MLEKIYTASVIEVLENGDAIIELPPEMLNELGWKEGDLLDINLEETTGKIVIKKVEK